MRWLFFLLILLASKPGSAQDTVVVAGRVMDSQTEEWLPFVNVVIYKGKEIIGATTSDFDGFFMIKFTDAPRWRNISMELKFIGYSPVIAKLKDPPKGRMGVRMNPDVGCRYIVPEMPKLIDRSQPGGVKKFNREEIHRGLR